MSALPASIPPPDYKGKADQVYQSLIKAYEPEQDDTVKNYWQLGCAFSAILEYYLAISPENWPDLSTIYEKQQRFEKNNKLDCLWFDDFLWWAIASLETKKPDGPLEANWIEVFNSNWDQALRGLKVWDNHKDRARYAPFRPRFENGIWNAEWNPQDPWSDPAHLKGIQNAVVNALFLTAAAQATNLRGFLGKDYSQFVAQEYGFLQQWFNLEPASDSLLYTFKSKGRQDCALIHERVSSFYGKSCDPNDKSRDPNDKGRDPNDKGCDPNYDPKFFWAGDQGLMLAALMSMNAMSGDPGYITFAREIINGVKDQLVDDQKLLSWPVAVYPPDQDDYNSGIGIFTRYMCKAWRTNPKLKEQLKGTCFDAVITNMANQLLTYNPPDPPADKNLNSMSNNLSILVAAAVIQNSPSAPA